MSYIAEQLKNTLNEFNIDGIEDAYSGKVRENFYYKDTYNLVILYFKCNGDSIKIF